MAYDASLFEPVTGYQHESSPIRPEPVLTVPDTTQPVTYARLPHLDMAYQAPNQNEFKTQMVHPSNPSSLVFQHDPCDEFDSLQDLGLFSTSLMTDSADAFNLSAQFVRDPHEEGSSLLDTFEGMDCLGGSSIGKVCHGLLKQYPLPVLTK